MVMTMAETTSAVRTHQPLKGQKALVTGASSGIGAGVARALGAAGASVAVNYVVNPDAEWLAARALGTVLPIEMLRSRRSSAAASSSSS